MTGYDNPRPISELLARLSAQDSTNLRACMTSGLNAWMQALSLLGGQAYAKPADLERLLQILALIETSAPLGPSPQDFAPKASNGGRMPAYQTQSPTAPRSAVNLDKLEDTLRGPEPHGFEPR